MKTLRHYLELVEANFPVGKQASKYKGAIGPGTEVGAGIAKNILAPAGVGATSAHAVKSFNPAAKLVPGVGTALSLADAIERYNKGDTSGVVLSVLAAAGYAIPGTPGWMAGLAADAANIGRDIGKGEYNLGKDAVKEDLKMNNLEHITKLRATLNRIEEGWVSTAVKQGPKTGTGMVSTDGKIVKDMGKIDPVGVNMGSVTTTGTKATPSATASSAPNVAVSNPKPGTALSTTGAQDARIVKDMGPADVVNPSKIPVLPIAAGAAKGANVGTSAGKNSNLGKAAAGTAALGAAGLAGYMSTQGGKGDGGNKPGPGPRPGGDSTNPPAPGTSSLSAEEEQELALLADKLSKHMGSNPDLDNLLLRHTKHRGSGGIPAP